MQLKSRLTAIVMKDESIDRFLMMNSRLATNKHRTTEKSFILQKKTFISCKSAVIFDENVIIIQLMFQSQWSIVIKR